MMKKSIKALFGKNIFGRSSNQYSSTVVSKEEGSYGFEGEPSFTNVAVKGKDSGLGNFIITENMDEKQISRMMDPLKRWRLKSGMMIQRKCPWCDAIPMAVKPIMIETNEATVCCRCKEIYYLNILVKDVGDIVEKFLNYKSVRI